MSAPSQPDRFHVLPHARPPIDPLKEPTVGHTSVDDNLLESALVAIWSAIGEEQQKLRVSVVDGVATLDGVFVTSSHREAAERAVRAVAGIRGIIDRAPEGIPSQASSAPDTVDDVEPRPFVHVVRYCGLDEASTTAAIRQAVDILDAFVAAQGASPIEALIIVYRNRLPGAITLEIGSSVGPELAQKVSGELTATTTPSGPMVSIAAQPGFAGLLQAADRLTTSSGAGPTYFWQVFGAEAFRPWRGYPQADVKAPQKAESPSTRARAARSPARKPKT